MVELACRHLAAEIQMSANPSPESRSRLLTVPLIWESSACTPHTIYKPRARASDSTDDT